MAQPITNSNILGIVWYSNHGSGEGNCVGAGSVPYGTVSAKSPKNKSISALLYIQILFYTRLYSPKNKSKINK